MKVLVTGSPDWIDHARMSDELARVGLFASVVLHAGGPGAERMAAAIATEFGLEVVELALDPSIPRARRHHRREAALLAVRPDLVVVFRRPGSDNREADAIVRAAREREIEVHVHASRASDGAAYRVHAV